MAAGGGLIALIDQLTEHFNRRSLDLPDGLFTRQTQFRLNGVAFEEMLGRSPSDPLVLMLARGAAGYRFAVKALQHAVPDARIERGEIDQDDSLPDGRQTAKFQCWLEGRLRGSAAPSNLLIEIVLHSRDGSVDWAAATIDPKALAELRDARLAP